MSMGCLFSSDPCPCAPCVRCFCGPGLHRSPSFASSSSCGTCDGGRSPICCGVVKAERLKGCSSPGNWQQLPCCPFLGWPWKNPRGRCCLRHCLACRLGLRWSSWRRAQGTPSCGCAGPRKRQRPASGISHIHSWHCSVQLLCGSGMTRHSPPRISAEGAERELYRLVPKVDLQAPEAYGSVLLSQHGDGCHRVHTMRQYQVRPANGTGQL